MFLRCLVFTLVPVVCACSSKPQNTAAPEAPTFQKTTATADGIRLSWKTAQASDDDWESTVIVRYSGPVNGQPSEALPKVGDAFGSGKVVYVGPESTFLDRERPLDCNVFTYQLWSRDKLGHWSGSVTVDSPPGGALPPDAPTEFTLVQTDTQVQLNWTKAKGAMSTKLVRGLGASPLTPEGGIVVYSGTETTTTESVDPLPKGQKIFYAAFSCDACNNCSTTAAHTDVLIPVDTPGLDGGSELRPTAMSASLSTDGQKVNLTWKNPQSSTGFTQVKVVRTLNTAPTGPDDASAIVLFTGLAETASEKVTLLLPTLPTKVADDPATPRTYYYVAYGCSNSSCEDKGTRSTFSLTVSQALRAGGYNIWWRHASADVCSDKTELGACTCTAGVCSNCPANNWWKSCDTNCSTSPARQLNAAAAGETQTIHDQFIAKKFSVSKVLSSEMCRGVQTAQGMNFGPAIEQVQALTYFVYDEFNRCDNTFRLLNELPAEGTNTAMVGHAGNTCPPLDRMNWGEAAIFKPNSQGKAIYITRVTHSLWATLP